VAELVTILVVQERRLKNLGLLVRVCAAQCWKRLSVCAANPTACSGVQAQYGIFGHSHYFCRTRTLARPRGMASLTRELHDNCSHPSADTFACQILLEKDQTRPDQTRPDQTRPDQTRPDARNS
jgi:hypothetical protein